jgi:hypothetical protein
LTRSDGSLSSSSLSYAQNGVTALFSMLITMLLCLRLARERKTSIAMRLALAGSSTVCTLANAAALFVINIAFFAASAVVIGIFPPPHVVIAYAFFISVFGVFLENVIKSESILLGLTVTGFLCTAILGGALIDIGGLIPSLDAFKYLFATYYFMEGLRGYEGYTALFWGGTALVIISLQSNIIRLTKKAKGVL